jgi:phenylpropionate dioxygenase-like ring-hydroxylating dioxygenase large terminal subunit
MCWSDELARGELKPLHYFDRELVIWRDAEGIAHVADAFCPHLGAHLGHGGRVEGCEIVCPFHGWRFDGTGRNVAIPYAKRAHPTAQLSVWPSCEKNGLVLAWYHPAGAGPGFEIPEIPALTSDAFAETHKAEWTIATSWQETAENGPDFVHLEYVHGAPVVPELESLDYEGPVMRVRAGVSYYSPRGDTKGRIDSDAFGPGFSHVRFRGIIDLDMVDWCVPIDFERIVNHKGYRVSKAMGAEKVASVGQAFIRDLRQQMEQDIAIFEHKIWRERPLLVPEDGPILEFRRWARQFYVAADPAERA